MPARLVVPLLDCHRQSTLRVRMVAVFPVNSTFSRHQLPTPLGVLSVQAAGQQWEIIEADAQIAVASLRILLPICLRIRKKGQRNVPLSLASIISRGLLESTTRID